MIANEFWGCQQQWLRAYNGCAMPRNAARLPLAVVRAMRPLQWVKNLLVFLPMFFTLNEAWSLDDLPGALDTLASAALALLLFCAISGGLYLFNDVLDIERDRVHPVKRRRPVASGAIPPRFALVFGLALPLACLYPAFLIAAPFGAVALAYVIIQTAYSLGLKRAPLLDVFSVASGFVLRVLAGAAVVELPISPWLYLCTGLAALFIAVSKRRSELARAGETASEQRDALASYTLPMLDQLTALVATSALVSYALYTFTAPNLPGNHSMMLTIPFVAYGMFRYIQLVHLRDAGEDPETIVMTDPPMIAAIALWLATSATILYLAR